MAEIRRNDGKQSIPGARVKLPVQLPRMPEKKHSRQEITTIKLTKDTKERLERLRIYKRESYDEIVQSMLNLLNLCRISPEKARIKLIRIDRERKKSR
jgi:DNA-binding TFAR19-related protein (PDSD5 family)